MKRYALFHLPLIFRSFLHCYNQETLANVPRVPQYGRGFDLKWAWSKISRMLRAQSYPNAPLPTNIFRRLCSLVANLTKGR